MLLFIILCVAIMVIDEARRKGYDLEKMKEILRETDE